MGKVRTRFAPSPTGKMHVGNLRTALYTFLIAKHEGGDFLLRIEDTDRERYVEGALDIIYATLDKAGLVHDEGPDKDGGYGPYVQSERQARGIYLEYAKKLIDKGQAYYCFCENQVLEEKRRTAEAKGEAYRYDKTCLKLSKEEVEEKLKAKIPYVIRQNNPSQGETSFKDILFGEITVPNSELEDMILIKSDGYPTYNFANVVDDHLMDISHVVRGNEYLSSAPKYNRLYEAFGWEIPTYVHVPIITDENHKKLSKRLGHSSYEDLLDQGYLNEAIINFVVLLGWSSGDDEFLSLEEMIEKFDYRQIKKSPAVFDMAKLKWMNSEYIKRLSDQDYYEMVKDKVLAYFEEDKTKINPDLDYKKIAILAKTRIDTLNEVISVIDFFREVPDYKIDIYNHKKMKTTPQSSLEVLRDIIGLIEGIENWDHDSIKADIFAYAKDKKLKNAMVLWPIRTALSGKESSPGGAIDLLELLGKKESINRIYQAIDKLKNDLE